MADEALKATADLLRMMLSRTPHRERWWRHVRRTGQEGGFSQAAIARVIALHLWESGQRSDSRVSLPRELKDRVHRALGGEVLSAETLAWFVEAFAMSDAEAAALHETRFGGRLGLSRPVAQSLRSHRRLPLPQRHRTLSVFEHRVIGASGQPLAHHTTRAITAWNDRVESLPYWLMPGMSNVIVTRGGRVTARHEFPDGAPVVEIALNSPIGPGEVASLQYTVEFGRQSGGPCREYRRVAHGRTENIDIVVEFHPELKPTELWWVIWDDFEHGNVIRTEPAVLDPDRCAHRFLPYLENAAAGFRWNW